MIFNSYAQGGNALAGVRLVSCGHIFAKEGREILRPQGREDFLLFYIAKGEETFYLDKPRVAGAGSFVFFKPHEKQHHATRSGAAEFYYVHFSADALPEGITLESAKIHETQISSAPQLFEQIIDETFEKKPQYEILCLSLLFSLFALIQRENARTEARVDKDHGHIARAIQYIGRSFSEDLSLADYAAMCMMSKYHFLRTFKRVTGQTPFEYRTRIRIENAKQMLESGDLSVAEIGEKIGFSSPAHFSTVFKKLVGVSPKNYAKMKTIIY